MTSEPTLSIAKDGSERDDVALVRRFSRAYTSALGLLSERFLGADLTLPEGRAIFELAQPGSGASTPGELAERLRLDPGYVTRLVASLERRGLVQRGRDARDGRRVRLSLTEAGAATFAAIDARSRAEVSALLDGLAPSARRALVSGLGRAGRVLEAGAPPAAALRRSRPGDLGWVVSRHGALYAAEYGWDESFEGLVAGIAARFLAGHDPAREICLVAEEADGAERLGSVMIVAEDTEPGTARLRLLLVEPGARGSGLGRRLVRAALAFAGGAGYGRVVLWTNDVLRAARALYEREGFVLTAEDPHRSFGVNLVGQSFALDLHSWSGPTPAEAAEAAGLARGAAGHLELSPRRD